MRNSKAKGFTLIELIVVMAIIGVLAAILVPSMIGYLNDSKYSKANANAKQVYQSAANWCTKCETNNTPVPSLPAAVYDLTKMPSGSGEGDAAENQTKVTFDGTAADLQRALVTYMGGQPNAGKGCAEISKSAPVWAQWAGGSGETTDTIFGQYPGELNANNSEGGEFGAKVDTAA